MNRRQLLRGLGALPIAGALSCRGNDQSATTASQCHTVQITLEGAFALVLRRQNDQYRITAFSPAPPKEPPKNSECPKGLFPIEPHEFYFNGKPQPSGTYHFELLREGLDLSPRPIIDVGFRDFTAETDRWRLGDNFVTIDLPCPKTITFYGQPETVVFAFPPSPPNPPRIGRMPTNHILEFQVHNPSEVKMLCRGLKDPCRPSSTSTPTVTKFSFGVGVLPNRDQGGQHAVKFFNYLICAFFPDLVKAYELSQVRSSPGKTTGAITDQEGETHARMVPAVLKDMAQPRLLTVSSVVDCQAGGIIVSTDRPPLP
jgi:hypothetical protein